MIKKTILLFLSFFLLFGFSIAQKESDETTKIYWSDWYNIEWADFQGKPNTEESIAAQSSIGLPYSFISDGEGEMTVMINVCFIKNESWSKIDKRNNVLLQHEQLHFNIAELNRRMIVKNLLEATFTKENHRELLDEIVKDGWLKAYREMQDKYDAETNYSRNFREQINWNRFAEQELKNYEEYNYTELKISFIN